MGASSPEVLEGGRDPARDYPDHRDLRIVEKWNPCVLEVKLRYRYLDRTRYLHMSVRLSF